MSEGSVTRSSPAPVAASENDDLLREILLRLPPLPSSLLRASLVCKLWRCVVSDPGFLRRYRDHHGKPPLIGFFTQDCFSVISFTPTLDWPNRIPAARFSLPLPLPLPKRRTFLGNFADRSLWKFHGCCHGLALMVNIMDGNALVCNPVTGDRRWVPSPQGTGPVYQAAVVRSAGYNGQLMSLGPFKLVLLCGKPHQFGRLYLSDSGMWVDIHWMQASVNDCVLPSTHPGILVGNAVCWLLFGRDILVFDLDTQSVTVIKKPVGTRATTNSSFQILRTKYNEVGLAVVSEFTNVQLWERKANLDGVMRWVLQEIIELDKLLSMEPSMKEKDTTILGFAEDSNVMFLSTGAGVFMIHLESKKFEKISGSNMEFPYFPYTSFFMPGSGIDGGDDGVEMRNGA